ncbi:hypothetical protein HanRHA438_Chr10g0430801 [Helianthus annuus]|nr:hypothetical protein HanIR_Chr10g0451001 [Helianthus annuus]KAJ0877647.1 hypothetical protein HanRHA438_Chr10g0430801 [Helianthus annuus]
MSGSSVKNLPHWCLINVVNSIAIRPNTTAHTSEIIIEIRALAGRFAPSSFPTLVDTPRLNAEGKTYTNDVVWMRIPIEATVALGFASNPHSIIMSSYHHHSRHTETHVGMAYAKREDHPRRQSALGATHESL